MSLRPTRKMKTKLNIIVLGLIFLFFIALLIRIFYIAVFATYNGEKYAVKAENQQLRSVQVNADRGTIYDRNMKVLAQSATVWTVFLSPNDIKEKDREGIAQDLAEILEMDYDTVLEKTKKKNYYEIVKKQVEKPVADQITELAKEKKYNSIHLVEDTKRYYPYGNFASHLIGFTGSDNQGLYGIEKTYDDVLKGTPGKIVAAKNALGTEMPFEYEQYYAPKQGQSVVLSLDETLQHYLEKAVDQAVATHKPSNRAAGIIIDTETGEVLAMTTKPDYDLNDPFTITDPNLLKSLEGLSGDDLKTETANIREKQWTNKMVSETYEPGSVFKVVTSSSALEEKTMSLDTTFSCPGYIDVAGTKMKCWKAGGHGQENFVDAVVNSCNPAFVRIGQSLGAKKFFQYFNAYGLTEKTGIDLPGETKPVANVTYYTEDKLGVVELASESFGQSLSITPIQMATAACAVVNGGNVVTPHVAKQIIDKDGNVIKNIKTETKRQVISEETSDQMRMILEQVVSANGGSNAYVKGYRIGGKSGTAEKLSKQQQEGVKSYVSSYVGVAPANDPKIAVLILVDEATSGDIYGSVIASPAVASVMADALPYLGVEPQYTQEELEKLEISVPYLINETAESAKAKLTKSGLSAKIIGNGTNVLRQVPESGSVISKDSTVILYTDDSPQETTIVPDVMQLTQAQANQKIQNAGLNIHFSGGAAQHVAAKAMSQSIPAGERVPKGTVITVEFLRVDETG